MSPILRRLATVSPYLVPGRSHPTRRFTYRHSLATRSFSTTGEPSWGRRWVFFASLAIVLGGTGGGMIGATTVSLEATIHSWQKTEAELLFAPNLGSFADNKSLTQFVDMGANRIRFPLSEAYQRESVSQRLDPCECPWGLAVGRIGLISPFAYEGLAPEWWIPGGSVTRLIPDATMQLVEIEVPQTDPQIQVYFDIQSFVERSTIRGIFAGGAVGLVVVALGLWVSIRVATIRSGASPGGSAWRPSTATVPTWVAVIAGGVGVYSVAQMLVGAPLTGITIDEGYHLGHLQNFLAGGNYSSESYGPVAALFAHGVNVVLGNEIAGMPMGTPEAFAGRHIAMAILGALALGASGVAAGVMLRSWRWGIVGASLLGSLPLWVGHSMFNIKDIPVGAGYALVTAGLIVLLASHVRPGPRVVGGGALFVVGAVLAMGTRPGMWPALLAGVLVAALLWLVPMIPRAAVDRVRAKRGVLYAGVSLVIVFVGAVVSLLFLTDVGKELFDAVARSLDHPWSKSRRYAGIRVYNRPEAGLVFQILLSQIPVVIGVLFLTGVMVSGVIFVRWLLRKPGHQPIATAFPLLAIQVFAPFAALIVFDPVLYDGIRQILFVLPAVALFATIGLWATLALALRLFSSRRVAKNVVGVVAVLALLGVAVDQTRLFPFNYTYVNTVAQDSGVEGAWESDYWDGSMKEAIEETVAVGDPITCGFTHSTFWNISDIRSPCITISPYLPGLAPASESVLNDREFWTIRSQRDLMQYGPPPFNCFPESAVTRNLRFEPVVMSRLYRCIDY